MEFKIEVPSGLGEAVGNLLRQIAYVDGGGWRPIGFSIKGIASTMLTAKTIVEDMVFINSQLTNLSYAPNQIPDTEDFYVIHVDKNVSPITVNDISGATNMFTISGDNKTIITCTDQSSPLSMELYMYKSVGVRTSEENRKVLKEHGYVAGQVVSMVSRHTSFKRVGFQVLAGENSDTVLFSLEPIQGVENVEVLVKRFCDLASSIFSNMGSSCA